MGTGGVGPRNSQRRWKQRSSRQATLSWQATQLRRARRVGDDRADGWRVALLPASPKVSVVVVCYGQMESRNFAYRAYWG